MHSDPNKRSGTEDATRRPNSAPEIIPSIPEEITLEELEERRAGLEEALNETYAILLERKHGRGHSYDTRDAWEEDQE